MSAPDRRRLVDRNHSDLSVRRQCRLLGVARSGVYRPPPPAANDDDDLALMRRIDELFAAWPFLGSRRMTAMLGVEGHAVNRKRVPGSGHGLGEPGGALLAAVEHDGHLVLSRRARGGALALRAA